MKLYHSQGTCSLAPHIALREAGIAFEAIKVNLKTHQLADGTDYYSINPLGYIPMLELDDGTRLREGQVIGQYIADLAPLKNLAPANGTLARYRLQEWLAFIATEVHKGFSPLFKPTTPDEYKTIAREKVLDRLTWIDSQLDDRLYLTGDQFTVADAYLFTVSQWAASTHVDITHLGHLQAFLQRVAARPAVQEALKAEA